MTVLGKDIWYHIAQTPDGLHVHRLDQDAVRARRDAILAAGQVGDGGEAEGFAVQQYCEAIRADLGFPAGEQWMQHASWSSGVSPGEPHPDTMRNANVHTSLPDLPPLA